MLPTLLVESLPWLVGTIALAAVFSAEVSTCDAILFMLSTSLSQDLYKRFIDPHASDRRLLLVARLAAVAGGVGGVIVALQLETIIAGLRIFYSLLSVSLFVPVLGGLFVARAGAAEALASMAAGIGALLAATYIGSGRGIGPLNPEMLGLLASAAAYWTVMAVRRQSREETWTR